jgi:acyl carrier protein
MHDCYLRLVRIIESELDVAPERIAPNARLADLGDSLAGFSLMVAVETEFDICIDEAQERGLVTVADLVRLLEERPPLAAT